MYWILLVCKASATQSGGFQDVEGETEERRRARLERHQRTQERAVCISLESFPLMGFVASSFFCDIKFVSQSGASTCWEKWSWSSSTKRTSWEKCKFRWDSVCFLYVWFLLHSPSSQILLACWDSVRKIVPSSRIWDTCKLQSWGFRGSILFWLFNYHILNHGFQRIGETLDVEIKRWGAGKEGNLRALLSTLQYVCHILSSFCVLISFVPLMLWILQSLSWCKMSRFFGQSVVGSLFHWPI